MSTSGRDVPAFSCSVPVRRRSCRASAPAPCGRRLVRTVAVAAPKNRAAQSSAKNLPDKVRTAPSGTRVVDIYDTTLRDGAQGEGISFSLADKLKLAAKLDTFGVSYLEGGYPGSNEKDSQFFDEVGPLMKRGTKVAAFGNTRYKYVKCEDDMNVQALASAGTPVITLVGKSWARQVRVVLEAEEDENLAMIRETVDFFKALGKEVMLDAEHFFDGFKEDEDYAMKCLGSAVEAGVDVLVLCDTNGGCVPWEIERITSTVCEAFPDTRVGIHCHNDMGLAVANTMSAVHAGASVVQGTINGYGERTGNANLTTVIPALQLKMGYDCVGDALTEMTGVSRYFDEVANQTSDPAQPFTGVSAFAHKGGLHVAAVLKDPDTYQFIDPEEVGNQSRMLVSELSGRHNILSKAKELGFDLSASNVEGTDASADWNSRARKVLLQVKELENKGYSFEGADASVELFLRRAMHGYRPPFELLDFNVLTGNKRVQYSLDPADPPKNESTTQATVKIALLGPLDGSNQEMCPTKTCLEVGESSSGPVDAVNIALCKALLTSYPVLSSVKLVDYKVRILNPNAATGATTRVMVDFCNVETGESWTTVYAHPNIIVASVNALMDGFEFFFLRALPVCIL